ncbi:hypothetical protein [Staphylococcus hominis]|mgnify:CR=1 FL=1|jgi:hypothetical protein|uniref:hypothetical protein n=1 Tax=Staphylococcus hominis TaxID=1290 RepID=UPI00159F5A95|nr:hypothetical protein [Staphylococcus hominis]
MVKPTVKSLKPKLPNPWALGAQGAVALSCKHHTKYSCETSPAETSNPNKNLKNH